MSSTVVDPYPCPNPHCDDDIAPALRAGDKMKYAFHVLCPSCGMRGPRAFLEADEPPGANERVRTEAVALWNALPR